MVVHQAINLVQAKCIYCFGVYAWSKDVEHARRKDGEEFFCPYCGKSMVYRESETDRAKHAAREAEKRLAAEIARRDQTKAALASEIAAAAKLKCRTSAGVCPCCKRHFAKLQRHMATKHPKYSA